MTSIAERLLTADEFMALPDDPSGGKMELDRGRVVVMPPAGARHAQVSRRTDRALDRLLQYGRFGELLGEGGFLLGIDPDIVRAPDCAFVETARIPPGGMPDGPFPGVPTLAVEVVSPTDTAKDVLWKVAEYLDARTARVWVIRPSERTVTVYYGATGDVRTLHEGDVLTDDDAGVAVPGFELPLAELFA
jgi:Uma2 family endonuclease